ncbi:hypothetical protein PHMEG_00027221 [Phytophthora megakarya]|uniref:Uncharacterized protein n=1 Tax=Phytophthora megakarya TaxID=4795 RepID=A0A225V6A0_9STRA|nr:hypothetical protein PHMEG_00027221 [Phytophthora megakarya]
MSSVELPRVPSARSSNSSSSSSRTYLHSAGSINSEKSAQSVRSQRSFYQQEDEDENSQSEADETPHEEEPQESSGGLWDEVEHFLNKPSPSFSNLSGKASKSANKPPKSTLPALNGSKSSSDNQTTKPARASEVASADAKTIDPKLLQEAFAYANQLQQMNFNEEQQHSWRSNKAKNPIQRTSLGRTNSSSSFSSVSSNDTGSRGRSSGAKGSSCNDRKKKTKSRSSSAYSTSVKPKVVLQKKRSIFKENPSSAAPEFMSKVKGHMDPQTLQSLVSNFQNGTAIDELRRELAVSQQSMAVSRQALQNAAQNFFQSR